MSNKDIRNAKRQDYLDNNLTHEEYYTWLAEFIGATDRMVPFTAEQVANSKDPHLNDLRLDIWDAQDWLVRKLAYAKQLPWSLSDTVCVLKQLARNRQKKGEQK